MTKKIETLKTRVENTNKKIEKLEKKLARINEALNSGSNPYMYDEYDLRVTTKELATAKESLRKYEEQLAIELNKEGAPKIEVLVNFLKNWKAEATEYYLNECIRCKEMKLRHQEERKAWETENERTRWYRSELKRKQEEEIKINFTNLIVELSFDRKREEKLEAILTKEVENKYEDLVNRISKVTGEIKDCQNLYIANNGSINGYVVGEKAKAKVETITAGGYNIQCLHYRVLVNKIR